MTSKRATTTENLFILPTGAYWIRARATDPRTGKRVDTSKTLPLLSPLTGAKTTKAEALAEMAALRSGLLGTGPAVKRQRFGEYAATVIQQRIDTGAVTSPATKAKYWSILRDHMGAWKDVYLDRITRADVKIWHADLGKLVQKWDPLARAKGAYSPNSVNDWLTFFVSIMTTASNDDPTFVHPALGLPHIRKPGYKLYTRQEPNALRPDEIHDFLDVTFKHEHGHFAMIALGMMTGRRACELRPLRRQGPMADIDWATGLLEVRRSQTLGAPMDDLKQKKDVVAYLPALLVDILRAHSSNLKGIRATSDLLFPPRWTRKGPTGEGFMTNTVLHKPIANICGRLGITKRLTPKGIMRRTYQDLCRAANVTDLVQRGMSGHGTIEMRDHYSTVAETEGRDALVRMAGVAGLKEAARL